MWPQMKDLWLDACDLFTALWTHAINQPYGGLSLMWPGLYSLSREEKGRRLHCQWRSCNSAGTGSHQAPDSSPLLPRVRRRTKGVAAYLPQRYVRGDSQRYGWKWPSKGGAASPSGEAAHRVRRSIPGSFTTQSFEQLPVAVQLHRGNAGTADWTKPSHAVATV